MSLMDTFKSGYDSFYTLKPESWKDDLKRLYLEKIENRKKEFNNELEIYESKLNMFLK